MSDTFYINVYWKNGRWKYKMLDDGGSLLFALEIFEVNNIVNSSGRDSGNIDIKIERFMMNTAFFNSVVTLVKNNEEEEAVVRPSVRNAIFSLEVCTE